MSHHKCEADHYSGLLLYWMGVELQLYSLQASNLAELSWLGTICIISYIVYCVVPATAVPRIAIQGFHVPVKYKFHDHSLKATNGMSCYAGLPYAS